MPQSQSTLDIHRIAGILSRDITAVERRLEICGQLGIGPHQYHDYKHLRGYEFFVNLLVYWTSREPGSTLNCLSDSLRALGLNNASSDVLRSENAESRKEKLTKVWYGIREPVDSFTGREFELGQLHAFLSRNAQTDTMTVISQATTVAGLGGIGKSELARVYARKYIHAYDGNAIWINAETSDSINSSLLNVVKLLGIEYEKDCIRRLFEHLYEYFSDRKCLIILDNVEELDVLNMLPKCLPPDAIKPCILITSRKGRWRIGIEVLTLQLLPLDEAIEFIQKCLPKEASSGFNEKNVEKLANTLQRLPLALQQAVAYIKFELTEDPDPIQKYLQSYESERAKDLLKWDSHLSESEKPTFYTWKVTLERIATLPNGSLAIRIIRLISYFAPNDIPTEIFQNYITSADEVNAAINLLKSYSMIGGDPQKIKIHRLVQHVVRIQAEETETDAVLLLREAIGILKSRYDNDLGCCTTIKVTDFSGHSSSVWTHALKHSSLVKEFGNFPLYVFKYRATKSNQLRDRLRLAQKSKQALEKVLGHEHEYLLKIILEEICVLWNLTYYKEALETLKGVYPIVKIKLANELSELIQRLTTGTMYCKQNTAELLEPFQALLRIQIEEDGGEHDRTLNTIKRQASLLMRLSRLDDSLKLLKRIYKVQKKQNILGHPNALAIRTKIADILEEKGQLSEALEIYVEVHLATKKLHAEEHGWKNIDSEKCVERCVRKLTTSYFLSARRLSTSVVQSDHWYETWTENEAQEFVRNSFQSLDLEPIFVSKLCNILGRLPIALEQAISYIKTEGLQKSPESYLLLYILQERELHSMYENGRDQICLITWRICLRRIKETPFGKLAVKIMQLLAFLDSDTSISETFISDELEEGVEEAIIALKSYAMISVENGSIIAHPLTQAVVRSEYKNCREDVIRELIQKLEYTMTPYEKNEESIQALLPHAVSVWKHALEYDVLVKEFSAFPFNICTKLGYYRKHNEMLNIASDAEQRLIMLLGKAHHATASLSEPMEAYRRKFGPDRSISQGE